MYTHYSGKAAKLWLKCVKASQKRSRLSVDDDQPSPKRIAGNASATKRRAGPGFDSHLRNLNLYMINFIRNIQKPIVMTRFEHSQAA